MAVVGRLIVGRMEVEILRVLVVTAGEEVRVAGGGEDTGRVKVVKVRDAIVKLLGSVRVVSVDVVVGF